MQRMSSAGITGQIGEAIAARFLASLGYRIVDRNVRCRGGEIDLVAWHGAALVFVEVKTRRRAHVEPALQAVDIQKQRRLIRAAEFYLARSGLNPKEVRFDIVTVVGDGEAARCELLVGAFESG